MGLDQWIFKRVPENDEYDEEGNIIYDDESVLYWRKCNQIHQWFDNLVGGVENCGNYPVTIDDLKQLRNDCQRVLDNHALAEEVLPVMSGFYFGSYEYDEWYFMDLKNTVDDLNKFLDLNEPLDNSTKDEYYYHAWW